MDNLKAEQADEERGKLTLKEFICKDKRGFPEFNNFFLFFVYKKGAEWFTDAKRDVEWFQKFYSLHKSAVDEFTAFATGVYKQIGQSGMMSKVASDESLYRPLYNLYLKAREFASDEELFV